MADTSDTSVSGLVKGALDDMRDLLREEFALARAEMRQELNKLTGAAVHFGIAGVAMWFAGLFLLVAVALGISALFGWAAWAAFGLTAGLLVVLGAGFLMAGRRALREVRPLPRTVESVKENFR